MKIVLLRHGESRSAVLPDDAPCPPDDKNPLTRWGIEQIETVASEAARILDRPRIFSSDMRRARESAAVLARYLGTEVEVRPELREVMSVDAEVDAASLRRGFRTFWDRFYLGDAPDDLVVRARRHADRLCEMIREQHRPASDLILVSHGGMIEVLMAKLLGGYARVGYTVEYLLRPGAFHLLELTATGGEIGHLRLHCANCSVFPDRPAAGPVAAH